ncbi:hypothetical protein F5I97DRAFT_1500891 [Phlebopus sp. FC_14]|nr:hypothetical protein F5I97DRAFT_1500891 [Phlebopus sp. FC_14]
MSSSYSSSDESSAVLGLHSASSGLSSTASLLFSHPSESSDVQTEITPPNSPAGDEPLKTSHRLAQAHIIRPSQPEAIPAREIRTRPLLSPSLLINDESGYESDGDVRGTALGDPTPAGRRLKTSRVVQDSKQQRKFRTPSRLARAPALGITNTPPSTPIPEAGSPNPTLRIDTSTESKPSHKHKYHDGFPSSSSLTHIAAHEQPERRTRKAGIGLGLGLGLPPGHPLRTRAFTMPMLSPTSSSSTESSSFPPADDEAEQGKLLPSRPFPPPPPIPEDRPPKLLIIKPTALDTSPSPIELLPPSVMLCYSPDTDDSLDCITEGAFLVGERAGLSTRWQQQFRGGSMSLCCDAYAAPALVRGVDVPRVGEDGAPCGGIGGEALGSCGSPISGGEPEEM